MRTVEEIKDELQRVNMIGYSLSQGQIGAMIGELNRACGGDANRKLFLKAMFNVTSSKDLSISQQWALKGFIGIAPFGDTWLPRPDFEAECKLVLQKQAEQDG